MKSLSLIKPLSYERRIKSNLSIFVKTRTDAEHPVAVQRDLKICLRFAEETELST